MEGVNADLHSMEQRGVVLTFLMVYADRVGREKAVNPEEMMEQFPQLSAEARLVCSFMGPTSCGIPGAG